MSLISESKKIFQQLNIKKLQQAGIEREDIKKSSHTVRIVTYPPLQSSSELNPVKIFSTGNSDIPRKISIYLHLPFCTGKCSYCDFTTLAIQPEKFVDKYLDGIEKEINLLLKYPYLQNIKVGFIHIGGGSPLCLSSEQLTRIFKLLKTKFDIKHDAEITVESEPESIIKKTGEEKLKILLQNNVNRLSIGFQTFDDNILKMVKRRHNSKQAIESYNLSQKAGFENINIDLLFGLPNQTLKTWQNDLEQIKKLKPASITCYPLYIKQTAAIWPLYQKERQRFPSQENTVIMQIMANEFFKKLGYIQKPVWWFLKSPEYVYKLQIHRFGQLGEQLALGASGFSFINNCQYFNYKTVPQYLNALENGNLPIWKGIKLSNQDLMRRMILLGLKTEFNKNLFREKFGENPKDVFQNIWKKLENLELIEEDDEMIQLSYRGKLFADEVIKEFYSDEVKKLI